MNKRYTVLLNDIPTLAKDIAAQLKGGETLALIGDLGSGKTTFTKALAKAIGIRTHVPSPTFVIMNQYAGKVKDGKKVTLFHVDLYRTKGFREAEHLGLAEQWGKAENITIIEWADKIKKSLPKNAIYLYFQTA